MVRNLLRLFPKRRTIRVFALIGETGTGKSFRSRLIAEKHNIDLIVDDGLLIKGQTILAGRSAKREKHYIKAVKRAVFENTDHAAEVREAIKKEKPQSILLIGTSDKMIGRIIDRLDLPSPDQVIYIEDVASREEIIRAREIRKEQGKHVIPVPVIEVKKDPSHRVLDSIKLFIKRNRFLPWKKKEVEKTIVQPHYHRRGRLMMSEAALSQLVMHCIAEYNSDIKIRKIIIDDDESENDYQLELKLVMPYGLNLPDELNNLQNYIISNVERFSGIHIGELNLTVDHMKARTGLGENNSGSVK